MAEITEEVDKTIYPTHQGGCGEEFGATNIGNHFRTTSVKNAKQRDFVITKLQLIGGLEHFSIYWASQLTNMFQWG